MYSYKCYNIFGGFYFFVQLLVVPFHIYLLKSIKEKNINKNTDFVYDEFKDQEALSLWCRNILYGTDNLIWKIYKYIFYFIFLLFNH